MTLSNREITDLLRADVDSQPISLPDLSEKIRQTARKIQQRNGGR